MAAPSTVAYPISFLDRPVDRHLIMLLRGNGFADVAARFCLYQIWADFARGGGERREVCPDPGGIGMDPKTRLLEEYCRWEGKSGGLVRLCLESGFMVHEVNGGKGWLVCADYRQCNPMAQRSMQARGSYARALKGQDFHARQAAERHLEIFTPAPDSGISDGRMRDSMLLLHRISRAIKVSVPTDSVIRGGAIQKAAEILDTQSPDEIKEVLLVLIAGQKDQGELDVVKVLERWERIHAEVTRS